MLRFIRVVLSNPARPELPALKLKAIVTDEDFALVIGPGIAAKLQLEAIGSHESVDVMQTGLQLFPHIGPVRVRHGSQEASIEAINCGANGVVIGHRLMRRLQLFESAHEEAPSSEIGLLQESSARFIMQQERAMDLETCARIRDFALASQDRQPAKLARANPGSGLLKKEIRDSYKIDTKPIDALLKDVLYRAFADYIEPFFGVEIDFWEPPHLLLYMQGGKYAVHADGERRGRQPDGSLGPWERHMDRDISLVMYLNDDFTGGMLNFPAQKLKVQPKPGLLVAFPSTAKYLHAAEVTHSGQRLAIASWATVKGSPRVRGKPGSSRVFMDEVRART